ncbi:prephenate/arogenate dehydrogenase family protein [Pinisolibacter aquiterrae]|uniref:prephenate/arogenate dehydrogenase family protein n=1 Tax=Pinisolibacter aquiterrae TaxID=2815579 RepID=UPI001C3D2D57|nr:prephenate/arogenate dehydrogenase family protein [Pinisolibacter aquiterrae]MBV5262924.1 prephenate/arogenate dehydrogenase family protein [Pinisolibacter aquiterrae]MCC8235265.1 prephenate/arogenate dehydrogenase family protein [Pinisolibacter aquiterrae]
MTDAVLEPTKPVFRRLTLIGIGLIGSSIARGARAKGLAEEIVISTRREETLERACALGLGDRYCLDPAEAVAGADCVIVSVPVGASGAVAAAIADHLAPHAIVSDVGSVKADVVRQMAPHLPAHARFVPAHPVAGTEHSGPDAGFAELFENKWCIVTPPEGAETEAVETLVAFWRGLGSKVETMSPEHHDMVLAITSHIPHLIAYNIVGTAADLEKVSESEVIKFSAGGFRDFTRIAASDPTMWRDVFLHNREAVLEMLGRFIEDLFVLQRAVRFGDGEKLFEHFTRTRAIRRGILDLGQDTTAPDFGRVPKKD